MTKVFVEQPLAFLGLLITMGFGEVINAFDCPDPTNYDIYIRDIQHCLFFGIKPKN